MKLSMGDFKNYINLIGIKLSIGVTFFCFVMLIFALVGAELKYKTPDSLCFFILIFELIYGVILCYNILSKGKKYHHLIPFLYLNWFIGCFCTNLLINVFENLPVWVYVVTFLFCVSNFFVYDNFRKKNLAPFFYLINGLSFVLVIYYAVYLIPIAPISVFGIMALGLGFYGLVPAIVFISHSIFIVKKFSENRMNSILFVVGILSVFFGISIFTILLNMESNRIGASSVTKSFETNEDLPSYITISQNLDPNFFNEILLKKDIVYISTENFFEFKSFSNLGGKQYNERKIHDPIINIAYSFSENLNLSTDDRINILKSNFDKRLETEEQLWTGNDLITKNIKEDIKIFSNERLAYTEITMDIACETENWSPREAIYSFQLSEGSVATSLSLWVNGVERKSILTTKEKAEKAYKQIVGVEARDPSLMQWKEGNKVVVRVFPIMHNLPRTFKCGFTTPLHVRDNVMKYQSLDIKGPNLSNAATISRIQIVGNEKFNSDKKFELKNNYYINEAKGFDNWEAVFPVNPAIYSSSFSWKDKVYEIKPIEKEMVSFVPSEIVLDLNTNWELSEVKSFVNQENGKCFVFVNGMKKEITITNYEKIFESYKNLHYSLLPLYKLTENSLVITKVGKFSANFEELEGSKFLMKLKKITKQKHLKIINISEDIDPFWQTVKEQKYVEYLNTDLKSSLDLIEKGQFLAFKSAENTINIEPSNVSIQEKIKTSEIPIGSNHIFRMYAFGKVLEEQVKINEDSLTENQYVSLAKEANIVTPISSLIVLETDEDYEKNGIEKNISTLGNASVNNHGAVPEPHEWLLIITALILLFFYYRKSKKQTA